MCEVTSAGSSTILNFLSPPTLEFPHWGAGFSQQPYSVALALEFSSFFAEVNGSSLSQDHTKEIGLYSTQSKLFHFENLFLNYELFLKLCGIWIKGSPKVKKAYSLV